MNYLEATTYITSLSCIGGFQTDAWSDATNVYRHASCTCGWSFASFATDDYKSNDQVAKMCAHHQGCHINYNAMLAGYAAGILNYATARDRLVEFGMTENRADEWLDNALPHNIVTHSCNGFHSFGEGSSAPMFRCRAYRTQDGRFHNTCGEPCRWGMMKLGEGSPPWTEADKQ